MAGQIPSAPSPMRTGSATEACDTGQEDSPEPNFPAQPHLPVSLRFTRSGPSAPWSASPTTTSGDGLLLFHHKLLSSYRAIAACQVQNGRIVRFRINSVTPPSRPESQPSVTLGTCQNRGHPLLFFRTCGRECHSLSTASFSLYRENFRRFIWRAIVPRTRLILPQKRTASGGSKST